MQKRGRFSQKTRKQRSISYKKIEINLDDLVREVFKQDDLISKIYYLNPKYLLIGKRQAMKLNEQINNYLGFQIPSSYIAPIKPEFYSRIFGGMKVICIPWMDGMIVVPELE